MSKPISSIILFVAVMFSILSLSSAASLSKTLSIYEKKILSYRQDLVDIGKNINRDDCEIALGLLAIAEKYSIILTQIQDLFLIKELIHNQAELKRIDPIINSRIEFIIKDIDLSIKEINIGIAHVKNIGVNTIATNFRDDLRMLKEMLQEK